MSIGYISRAQCAVIALALFAGDLALAKTPVILASGRRDPRIYAIDLNAALKPENNNTPNAIVSRSLVSPRRLDGALLGDPANIVLSNDQSTAYVMNHHGSIVNAEFLQHGGRANISIMDVKKMLRREFDNPDGAGRPGNAPAQPFLRRLSGAVRVADAAADHLFLSRPIQCFRMLAKPT